MPEQPARWGVVVLREAERYMARLAPDEQARVVAALEVLHSEPLAGKPLRGQPRRSIRVGGLRIIYRLDNHAQRCVITAIGPRGDVYKKP